MLANHTSLDTRLRVSLSFYLGWRYCKASEEPKVAYNHPAMPLPVALLRSEMRINCSTLTTSALMRTYANAGWSRRDYRDFQVYSLDRPLSPVEAANRLGIGVPFDVKGTWPDGWVLFQGWRDLTPGSLSGHAFLAHVEWARGQDLVRIVESSSEANVGPRWRVTRVSRIKDEFKAALAGASLVNDPLLLGEP